MTRPTTLSRALECMARGEPRDTAMAGFLDTFYTEPDPARRLAMMAEEPEPTGDERLDALAGATAEYLAKQYDLPAVPAWVKGPARRLPEPWFTVDDPSPGMKAWLVFSSPAEFSHRNIFTESRPFRRASQRRP